MLSETEAQVPPRLFVFPAPLLKSSMTVTQPAPKVATDVGVTVGVMVGLVPQMGGEVVL